MAELLVGCKRSEAHFSKYQRVHGLILNSLSNPAVPITADSSFFSAVIIRTDF